MNEAEFDKFAEEYRLMHQKNIRITGESPEFFAEYKIVDLRKVWNQRQSSKEPAKILDFGGGVGASLPHIQKWFPRSKVTIADPSRRSLEIAKQNNSGSVEFLHFDGGSLPKPDGTFDIVFASCVFHHIPEAEHVGLMREIRRVLAPSGVFVVFEHNPWNPLTLHAVNTCPFDENAVLMSAPTLQKRMNQAGFSEVEAAFRIFFPRILRCFRPLEKWMTKVPLGAQYYVVSTI